MKNCLSFLFLVFFCNTASAQCLVSSIVINTGYDPVAGDTLTYGNQDPKWSVTALSSGCSGICACSPAFQAYVIPPLIAGMYTFATNPSSQWINFFNGTGYPTNNTDPYSATLSREFKTCVADSIVISFQFSVDNYITNLNIDGGPSLLTQPAIFVLTNFTTFNSFTATVYLAPGTHHMNFAVGNETATNSMNAHGLNLFGTMSSQTGINSIVKESDTTCNSYVCGNSCNFITLPDSATTCENNTISITATLTGTDSVRSIRWTPIFGFTDTTVLNPSLYVGTISGYRYITVKSLLPTNLVVNGDFGGGNTGFSSSYIYSAPPSSVLNEGYYTIYTNPNAVHGGFTAFGDHTTGTGNMMIINGGPSASDFWCQTITVTPYTDYDFSTWIANCSTPTTGALVPIIQFKINGSLIGTPYTVSASPGSWVQFRSIWNSGANTTATICIYDALSTAGGNDFVVDDISFQEICTARDSIYVKALPYDTTEHRRDTILCGIAGSPTLSAPAGYTSYRWSTGSTSSSISIAASGIYWVRATTACSTRIDTFNVVLHTPPTVNLGADRGFCVGDSAVLTSVQPSGNTYLWSNGSTNDSITVHATGSYWVSVSDGVCTTIDSINFTVLAPPPVHLGADTTNCDGIPVLIQSTDAYSGAAFLWSNGTTGPTFLATTTGVYWLQVSTGGCTGADTINVTILFDTIALLNRDTAICKGGFVQAIAFINPAATCQWLPTAGIAVSNVRNAFITPDTSAMYYLNVYMTGCPVKTAGFLIDVQPNPTVFAGGNKLVCQFDTLHLHATVLPDWYMGYTYNWTPGTDLDHSNTPNVVYTAGASQKYIVSVTTSAGCKGNDSAVVTVFPGNFVTAPADASACPHDSLRLAVTGGNTYVWHPGLYLSDSTAANPWINAIASQKYEIIATSSDGCRDTVSVNVHVFPAAVISMADSATISPGETFHIQPATNCNSFLWFPPAGLDNVRVSDPSANPELSTMYKVRAITENGCVAFDSITINVDPETLLYLPNAFAPGNDSYFSIIKRGEATLSYFRVFNRWGNLVFETKDINKGWDGTYKGAAQPFDVYVYELEAVASTGKRFNKHGNVTLIR